MASSSSSTSSLYPTLTDLKPLSTSLTSPREIVNIAKALVSLPKTTSNTQVVKARAVNNIISSPATRSREMVENHATMLYQAITANPNSPIRISQMIDNVKITSEYVLVPPAPRLVGIEPNPGPNPLLALAGASLVKNAIKLATTKKKKTTKQPKSAPNQISTVTKKVMNVAPVSRVYTHTTNNVHPIHPEYIDSGILFVKTDTNGTPYFATSSSVLPGVASAANYNCDLHPIGNNIGSQAQIFGPQIANLAASYTFWKLVNLVAHFETAVTTGTAGYLALGYQPDSAAQLQSYIAISSSSCSTSGPLWSQGKMTLNLTRHLPGLWHTVNRASSDNSAMQRQDFSGAIAVGAPIALPVSSLIGCIRFTGLIHFRELILPLTLTVDGSQPSNPAPITGNYFSTDLSATKANPFPASGTSNLPPAITLNSLHYIRFGAAADGSAGIWQLRLTATDVAGTITAGYAASANNVGTGTMSVLSSSISSAAPYSAQFIVAMNGADGTISNFSYLSITGPDNMTAGNTQFTITKIA